MVLVKNKQEIEQYFPKNTSKSFENPFHLKLHSELTNRNFEYEVEDKGDMRNYYLFEVDFSDLDNGEYVYFITNDDYEQIGLLRIGEVEYQNIQSNNKQQYTEYKF